MTPSVYYLYSAISYPIHSVTILPHIEYYLCVAHTSPDVLYKFKDPDRHIFKQEMVHDNSDFLHIQIDDKQFNLTQMTQTKHWLTNDE